ncbi:uncharacterized protein [Montipora foliosa]|uniref:uncharacterized protein n=1 Tax=Montipora foliosa TaxID=591990 RepID=UPI0035F1A0DF
MEGHRLNKEEGATPVVGEVVLVVGDEKNRGEWEKGKVMCLIQGEDGVVRGVILLHKGHTIERPLQLVCPLEIRGAYHSVHLQEGRRDEVHSRNQRGVWYRRAKRWFEELGELSDVKVPSCFQLDCSVEAVTLCTFSDASADAYGVATYTRYLYKDGTVLTSLVAYKTGVTPLPATSIPRLELMGAVLELRLALSIANVLKFDRNQLASCGGYHVAVGASSHSWQTDPSPEATMEVWKTSGEPMQELTLFALMQETPSRLQPSRFSSWRKLVRVRAWVGQFVNNCRIHINERSYRELGCQEIADVEIEIIKKAQRMHFMKITRYW